MKIKILILYLLLLFTSTHTLADTGSVIPEGAMLGIIFLYLIVGFAISTVISFGFRIVLEKVRKEKRKHIWYMATTALLLPLVYLWSEDEFHWYYNYESNHSYESKYVLHMWVFAATILIGFLIGYFITPKKNSVFPTNNQDRGD